MASPFRIWYQQQAASLAYRRGLNYARQTSHKLAIAALTQAIQKGYPHPERACVARGISRLQTKDTAGALADFETAINATATDSVSLAKAHHHRGLLRQQSGNEAGALADWSAAIAYWPAYPDPHYHRALLHLGQGHHRRALADLDAALQSDPTSVCAYLQRGNLRHQLGDIPGAVADWEIAVCNDFTLEDAKQKLANVQQAACDAKLSAVLAAPLAAHALTVEVNHSGSQLDIHIHRQVGTGINYYTLPDLIRAHLVPLHLAEVTKFQLIGHVANVNRPDWSQTYELYKGQPCPPSNWQAAFSTLVLFPPFGIPAFIQAARVKKFYNRGQYMAAVSASKGVKGLCVAGSVTLGFCTLLPLGYAAYDSMKETPTFRLVEQATEQPNRPYHAIWNDESEL
ncbi:MAG: tetratricopeptide repeat protein [Phormidesmis sp.]